VRLVIWVVAESAEAVRRMVWDLLVVFRELGLRLVSVVGDLIEVRAARKIGNISQPTQDCGL